MGELNQSAIDMLVQFPKMMLLLIETMKKVNESGDYVAPRRLPIRSKVLCGRRARYGFGQFATESNQSRPYERDAGLCVKNFRVFFVVRDIASLKAGLSNPVLFCLEYFPTLVAGYSCVRNNFHGFYQKVLPVFKWDRLVTLYPVL